MFRYFPSSTTLNFNSMTLTYPLQSTKVTELSLSCPLNQAEEAEVKSPALKQHHFHLSQRAQTAAHLVERVPPGPSTTLRKPG